MRGEVTSFTDAFAVRVFPSNPYNKKIRIDVRVYAVNQLLSGDPNLFAIPQGANNSVDLTTLSPANAVLVAPTSYHVPAVYQSNAIGPMPYRGLVR